MISTFRYASHLNLNRPLLVIMRQLPNATALGCANVFVQQRDKVSLLQTGLDRLAGRASINQSALDFDRNPEKKFAAGIGWSGQAFAGGWSEERAVGLTHQIASALGKEVIVDPIHRDRYVTAAVDVGMEIAAEVDHEAFFLNTVDRKHELVRLSRPDFVGPSHPITDRPLAAARFVGGF